MVFISSLRKVKVLEKMDRIVRIGTHTGENQLRSRLMQHFVKENKNRSIFRKNIGRCFFEHRKSRLFRFMGT